MSRYRCGPLGETGCGVFEHDDGPDGLFTPVQCTSCHCTFHAYPVNTPNVI